ncbi:MAG: hypothetical protein K6A40_13775 [Solobacterium sp.]|nr:hypothetical protein [Solobacterium sp.]
MTDRILADKRILMFSPAFFGYEDMITGKMREMGAEVDFFDERSVTSSFSRAMLHVRPSFFRSHTHSYYDEILAKIRKNDYDYILFVKCDMADEKVLKLFRQTFPHAKMILLLWDSMRMIFGIEKKFSFFDRLLSFDRFDCEAHPELIFRPNFYMDDCLNIQEKEIYDWSFCGTIHSDRLNVINQIRSISMRRGYRYDLYPYLQSRLIYHFYKRTRKEFRNTQANDFCYEKTTFADSMKTMAQSRAVVDIEHPNQSGLTTRTLLTLAMGKKLITTNEDTRNYEFYDPAQICIIDRENVEIPEDFLKEPGKKPSKEFYDKYSLRRWILDVLGEDE